MSRKFDSISTHCLAANLTAKQTRKSWAKTKTTTNNKSAGQFDAVHRRYLIAIGAIISPNWLPNWRAGLPLGGQHGANCIATVQTNHRPRAPLSAIPCRRSLCSSHLVSAVAVPPRPLQPLCKPAAFQWKHRHLSQATNQLTLSLTLLCPLTHLAQFALHCAAVATRENPTDRRTRGSRRTANLVVDLVTLAPTCWLACCSATPPNHAPKCTLARRVSAAGAHCPQYRAQQSICAPSRPD